MLKDNLQANVNFEKTDLTNARTALSYIKTIRIQRNPQPTNKGIYIIAKTFLLTQTAQSKVIHPKKRQHKNEICQWNIRAEMGVSKMEAYTY